MLVSWKWLEDYVALGMPREELEERLAMTGLNHEGTEIQANDVAIDLEVTSNRPDCLGHIGVAREIAVLWDEELKIPDPQPVAKGPAASAAIKVSIECPELCSRYTARVIRGVKIGPSPAWLVERLETIGVKPVNNVVDVTNYVLFECGQPLHAFDLAHLKGGEIIVREAAEGEEFEAIDHSMNKLAKGMCVIADGERAVALGGVMGGVQSEVSDDTTDLLIEAADFDPLAIRGAARALKLFSPSSYRFERGVDPEGVDWASRRCCELILELAGGALCEGVVVAGEMPPAREPVVLRYAQVPRVLGIELPAEESRRILLELGCEESASNSESVTLVPPTWRADLTREIDLIEEIARIHGYEEIPEDAAVPMAPSHRSDADRVMEKVRTALVAAGFDEAMTASMVDEETSAAFSPWTGAKPLSSETPMLRGANLLRRSVVPSLLWSRQTNQSLNNPVIELFETAKVYLPTGDVLPREEVMVAITSGRDYYGVKGVLECLVRTLSPTVTIEARETSQDILDAAKSAELLIGGERLGFLGELSPAGMKKFKLRAGSTVAEISFGKLCEIARLVPQQSELSAFPSISQDFNLVVAEELTWADLATTVSTAAGDLLEELEYCETYRDAKKDGPGRKRLLFSFTLRSPERTLTGDEAEAVRQAVLAACKKEHDAELLA